MAIIVISHQMGAGGPEIGMALAQRLGYRYVNQELLLDAARRYGLAQAKLSHLEESKPRLFERFDTETRHHITVPHTRQLEVAETGNAVLMRGGGQWRPRGGPPAVEGRGVVAARALAARAEVAGARHPEAGRYGINVKAEGDVVALGGTAALDGAVAGARGAKGVREVGAQRVESPPIPPFVA